MRAVLAQSIVEAKLRLRSSSTIFAVLGVFALSFLYLPDPSVNRVSVSWRNTENVLMSGVYDSTYIGAVIAMLSSLFMTLIGFYLVAGSIRRDREKHVLEIIAATPITRMHFIAGKWLAHTIYLLAVASTSLVAGLILFYRYGDGQLDLQQFLMPWLLTLPAAMAFTAALTVLFDVTPGLRSRFGWIVWFFTWTFVLIMFPSELSGRTGANPTPRPTIFDPAGTVAFYEMIESTVTGGDVRQLSMGVMIVDEPVTRIRIGPIATADAINASRFWNLVWVSGVVALAGLLFRFKSTTPPRRRERPASEVQKQLAGGMEIDSSWRPSGVRRPSLVRAVLAEAKLTWDGAGLMKWPLLVASIASIVVPIDGAAAMAAVALLLLGPIIAEVAAREALAGTGTIIVPSPGVPALLVLWKVLSLTAFVGIILLPLGIKAIARSPEHGITFLAGTLGTIALATGLGALTGGGKFFAGLYVVAWYLALQGEPALDFTGWFVQEPSMRTAGVWLLAGSASVLAATLLEWRVRTARIS